MELDFCLLKEREELIKLSDIETDWIRDFKVSILEDIFNDYSDIVKFIQSLINELIPIWIEDNCEDEDLYLEYKRRFEELDLNLLNMAYKKQLRIEELEEEDELSGILEFEYTLLTDYMVRCNSYEIKEGGDINFWDSDVNDSFSIEVRTFNISIDEAKEIIDKYGLSYINR
ncbi:hypothetical protein [Clostridium paraputrificum]|uniref:hypothetical protein n=1 Tax=Clostridium paraputrificum TaxID=29363 RepID=UPI00189C8567|nr:hypothetical protein [Clostridium paraputrificum]